MTDTAAASGPDQPGCPEPPESRPPVVGSDDARAISCRLSEALHGIPYATVARITGFNQETTRRYLNDGMPSVLFLLAVSRKFGVSPDWLLLGRGPTWEGNLTDHYLDIASIADLQAALERRMRDPPAGELAIPEPSRELEPPGLPDVRRSECGLPLNRDPPATG